MTSKGGLEWHAKKRVPTSAAENSSPALPSRRTAATVTNGAQAATPGATANKRLPSAAMPTYHQIAAETGGLREPTTQLPGRPASDFMVDVIKSLKIEYIYSNPASSFRGLHESLINYGKNTMPEFLTVTHEESSVAMCHGHFKATGKPQMALMHGTVGLQHACMAVYNAWADRVPIIVVGGNDLDASKRPPGVPTVHSAHRYRRAGARLHQVGRPAGVAAAFRAVDGARLQIRDDAALWAGDDLARRRRSAGVDQAREKDLYMPKYIPPSPPHADPARCAKPRSSWSMRRIR